MSAAPVPVTTATAPRRSYWSGVRVLGLVFVLTLPMVTPHLRGADEIEYFSYLRSAVFDRDLEFGNEYQHFYDRDPQGLAGFKRTFLDQREPDTGRHINFGPLGTALLWAPFYLLTHLALRVAQSLGAQVVADGFSPPYLVTVCLASAVYGFAGLRIIHQSLRRYLDADDWQATLATLALWLGTPVLYYLTIAPGFSHAASLFVVSLLVWQWLRTRATGLGSLRAWALIGLLGGLAALVREQDGLFLIAPGLSLLVEMIRRRAWVAAPLRAAVMGLCAWIGFVPQLLAYHAINGRYHPSRLVTRKMTWSSPHFLGVLLDPGHGLFLWAPLLLLAAIGLLVAWRHRATRDVTFALAAAFLVQVWINGAVESWTQAGAFGSRRFVSATVVFAWGLAGLLGVLFARVGRRWSIVLMAVFVLWNAGLMMQFGLKVMPTRQELTWPDVAVNQVTALPACVGRAATLFVTDRERLAKEGCR